MDTDTAPKPIATPTKKGTMTLGALTHPQFIRALEKLAEKDLPAKSGYWLGRSIAKINSHFKEYEVVRVKALKKYVKLDSKGNFEVGANVGQVIFLDDAAEAAWAKELEELRAQEVDVMKISFDSLGDKFEIDGGTVASLDEYLY